MLNPALMRSGSAFSLTPKDRIITEVSFLFPNLEKFVPGEDELLLINTFYVQTTIDFFEFKIYGKYPYKFITRFYPIEKYQDIECRKVVLRNTPILIPFSTMWDLSFDVSNGIIYANGLLQKIYSEKIYDKK